MTPRVAVIGIGNTLMGDDGAGVEVLAMLKGRVPEGVDIVELGTGGINLVHVMAGYDSVVIIDAGDFGGWPGEIRAFEPDDVQSVKTVGYSLHDWDIFTSIGISKKTGDCPGKIRIVAIQPENLKMGEGLSETVKSKLQELADTVLQSLQ